MMELDSILRNLPNMRPLQTSVHFDRLATIEVLVFDQSVGDVLSPVNRSAYFLATRDQV
jgi:hypothetical protein